MHPTVKAARVAGLWYLTLLIVGPFTLMYVPAKLIVSDNAAATSGNILTHEMLFRVDIAAEVIGAVLFILVGVALYRLLVEVGKSLALVMLIFVVVSGTLTCANAVNRIATLLLFRGGDFLSVFDKLQLNALGMLFIRLHGESTGVNEMFWGLWLLPLGVLVIRSRFIPWILGVLLIINGFAYMALSVTGMVWPDYSGVLERWTFPAMFAELLLILWLLIKGANVKRLPTAAEQGWRPV